MSAVPPRSPSRSAIRPLVFRKRLGAPSEGFIDDQARHLPTAQAAFLGLECVDGAAVDLCGPVLTPSRNGAARALARLRASLGLGLSRDLTSRLRSFAPTLVHAHFATSGSTPLEVARACGVPLLVTAHGYDVTRNRLRRRDARRRAVLLEAATRVIAVSDFITSKLADLGIPREKVVRHYMGIDPRPFAGAKSEADAPTVLFIGRLTEVKGCGILLDAMRIVSAKIPEARLRFIGDGPLRDSLRAQARDMPSVEFLGVQDRARIARELQSAWVHCVPSVPLENGSEEALGLVFLEAQASGTPTVSFDSGGVPEAIEHGKTGYALKERSPSALAEPLIELLRSHRLRRQLGEAGRARVQSMFDVREQSRGLERIYLEAMCLHGFGSHTDPSTP